MCWLIIMSGVSLVMKRKKMCRQMTHLFSLRKERDSGIRTLGTVTRTTVFETVPIGHSGIFPFLTVQRYCFFSSTAILY